MERFTDAIQSPFLAQGLAQFGADYYAVLGVPMDAPLTEIRKSYRNIARLLHPDRFGRDAEGKEEAEQILARLVNPAFEVLSADSQRRDYDKLVRAWAERVKDRPEAVPVYPQLALMQQALTLSELQTFYRQAIAQQGPGVYKDKTDLVRLVIANELSIFNLGYALVYCRVGSSEGFGAPQPAPPTPPKSQSPAPPPKSQSPAPIQPRSQQTEAKEVKGASFANSHFERGKMFFEHRRYREAVQSLKEAVRISPENATYHSYLGQAYLRQGLPGMAKAEFTQALVLDPTDSIARRELNKGSAAGAPPPKSGSDQSTTKGKATSKPKRTLPQEENKKEGIKGALEDLWKMMNKPL
ncbi:DnaJ domain-containing protein [Anthocerotibacter panamensis]|uniref:DnaJ domain-containing protein n=1 Tax=Anthocerotibacter panamensis TaxID=2857077 RepID=UPI001C401DF7|nr:DnaJ domain-containing protein [Anthocerotibacter panamensis]